MTCLIIKIPDAIKPVGGKVWLALVFPASGRTAHPKLLSMKKFHTSWLRITVSICAAILLVFCSKELAFGQQHPATRPGVVRIKVSEALGAQLELKPISQTASGIIVTGINALDRVNARVAAQQMKRLFRNGGKFEIRHRKYGLHRWYELQIGASAMVQQAVSDYASIDGVERAEPVYQKKIVGSENKDFGPVAINQKNLSNVLLNGPPNDPMIGNQWHYNNNGQTGGTPGADIRAFDAWTKETGSGSVIVAVTDGGIQTDHPDLAGNMWRNPGEIPNNNIDDDNNGFIDDIHGYSFADNSAVIEPDDHGTHVAGTIAAVTNNGIGVAGVAGGSGSGDGVRLMSCATFSSSNVEGFPETYIYAADNGATISQNSWSYTYSRVFEQVVLDAIDYFIAEAGMDVNGNQIGPMRGGLVVFAAGNDISDEPYYPAFYASTFAVAATNHRDVIAWYSNYGAWVDISAPGGETYPVEEEGVLSTLAASRYGYFQGTSMACPHVSGVAALVVSKYTKAGFMPQAMRERLRSTATPIDDKNPGYAGWLGSGRLNAFAALEDNDNTPPEAITDLAIVESGIGTETLSWTVPIDPGGFVASYDIRYSTSSITAGNFNSATAVVNALPSLSAGETQTFTVTGLAGGTHHYFAVKAIDFNENVSPVSNVVSRVTNLAPVIQVSPASLTANLETAEIQNRTFTIRNTGPGPLTFIIPNHSTEDDFAPVTPNAGNVAPGGSLVITVRFNANNLFAGSYRKDLRIESNDPLRSLVILPLTLVVTNNNASIASVFPKSINFKSAQVGTTSTRGIVIHNAGSEPLMISAITSSNANFRSDFSNTLSIDPFQNDTIEISFSPLSIGLKTGTITIQTNDPVHVALTVSANGEGLNVPPIVVTPDSVIVPLEQGSVVSRTMTLTNNGSFDVDFRIEVLTKGLQNNAQKAMQPRALRVIPDSIVLSNLVKVHRSNVKARAATAVDGRYGTGFENFNVGTVDSQEDWFAINGWTIDTVNSKRGDKHLRGTAMFSGAELLALSPLIFEEPPEALLTTASMMVNLDKCAGTEWQIVPQGVWFVATRIRINADKTIDIMTLDEEYEIIWNRIPPAPSGYFHLAVEHNAGGDGSSGFPVFSVYINSRKVFTGHGIGEGIANVAFVCTPESQVTGQILDVDDFETYVGEFFPPHVNVSPVSGTLPAKSSIDVDIDIDATSMRFGVYRSDIVTGIDGRDEIVVPAMVTVTGEGLFTTSPAVLEGSGYPGDVMQMSLTISNTGGRPFDFKILDDLPQLSTTQPTGTLPLRGVVEIPFEFNAAGAAPGFYRDSLRIATTLGPVVHYVPVRITVFESLAKLAPLPSVRITVVQGQVTTDTFRIKNIGTAPMAYEANLSSYNVTDMSLEPSAGILGPSQSAEFTVTIDARGLEVGPHYDGLVRLYTNDPRMSSNYLYIHVGVVEDTENGSGSITREEWIGVPGRRVTSIPLDTPPYWVSELKSLDAPSNYFDEYGARIRGYIISPRTADFTFSIASDDHSELWLSTDMNPENKRKIAYVYGYTNKDDYSKYPSQTSLPISLKAGDKYYIEVLHKENTGRDHVSVGWEMEYLAEYPIPGVRLFPIDFVEPVNEKPVVSITSPDDGASFLHTSTIEINADANDSDGRIIKVEFYNGRAKLGTDAVAPYSFLWEDVAVGNYEIMAKAFDNYGATDSAVVNISVEQHSCSGMGSITHEVWTEIPGNTVSSIPLYLPPTSSAELYSFESPSNVGNYYGSRISGYICVPLTGNYTFWIASDDHSELWLSTDYYGEVNRVKIASVTGHTSRRQWDKYPTQKSIPIRLVAGEMYYIEALHKEAAGGDHLAVGWQLPDGTLERPIPGERLTPYDGNYPPDVQILFPEDGARFAAPAEITIEANASDPFGRIIKVDFYTPEGIVEDFEFPYVTTYTIPNAGQYGLAVKAFDSRGAYAWTEVMIEVYTCEGTGTLTWDIWPGITGTSVSSIPVDSQPVRTQEITSFETSQYYGNNYGARVSGYICPPQSGLYTFWIASDDNSELWLSMDYWDTTNKTRIGSVPGATKPRQWEKYPSQKSMTVYLDAGYRYYIEALHKEANGNDHVAVGWQLPDGTLERPIPGGRLSASPGVFAAARTKTDNKSSDVTSEADVANSSFNIYPNPASYGEINLTVTGEEEGTAISGMAQVEILSLTGVIVYTDVITCENNCKEISISIDKKFTPGIYLLNAVIDRKRYSKKLVIY